MANRSLAGKLGFDTLCQARLSFQSHVLKRDFRTAGSALTERELVALPLPPASAGRSLGRRVKAGRVMQLHAVTATFARQQKEPQSS